MTTITRRTFVSSNVAWAAALAGCGGVDVTSSADPTQQDTRASLSATARAPAPDPTPAPAPAVSPVPVPVWMTAPVGQWAQINGTPAPLALAQYSGVAWREDDTSIEVLGGLAGGHAAGQYVTNNEVYTLRLDVDSPAWILRRASSSAAGWDSTGNTTPYMPDGRPASRHVYCDAHWSPEQGAYLIGGMYWGSVGMNYQVMDAFIPMGTAGGDWAAQGAFPARPIGAGGYPVMLSVRDPASGIFYATTRADGSLLFKFNSKTKAWSNIALTGSGNVNMGGNAFDSKRSRIFSLSNSSWFVPAAGVHSTVIDPNTGVKARVSFNSSTAWTDFQSKAGEFVLTALDYDALHDCFYFYNGDSYGVTGQTQKVYRIKPNSGTTWDMDLLPIEGGVVPRPAGASGVLTKFKYVQRLNALVLVVAGQDVYYMRLPPA